LLVLKDATSDVALGGIVDRKVDLPMYRIASINVLAVNPSIA
jgi:hypothetical protein